MTAIAEMYGVSRRTAYRYLEGRFVDVDVAGWTTRLLVRDGRPPMRVSAWRRA